MDNERINAIQGERFVDALEEGRIVRVPESYALSEGLIILQRIAGNEQKAMAKKPEKKQEDVFLGIHELRKPVRRLSDDLIASLIDNFHWLIAKKRKQQGLTRKQLANSLQASENDLKMIENGILPSRDYVLVRKLEEYFKINLRKDALPSISLQASSLSQNGTGSPSMRLYEEIEGDIEIDEE